MRAFCARKIHCGGKNGKPIRMRYPCPAAQRPHRTHTIAQKPMGHTGAGGKASAGCAPKKRGERVQARPLMKGNQYGYHTCRQITSRERGCDCDGILNVTLSVTAQPDVVNNPVDIALVLDRSGSMTGTPMMHLKAGAKEFIDIVMKRTGGRMGRLANGNRIGIVSFAGTASIDVPLTEDVEVLKQAVDALQAQGNTNHADAFTQAGTLFGATMRKKVLVIFTDGETTVGPDPAPIAAALRDDDVEIYCIGLVGRTGLNEETLRSWASEPVDEHVITTPNEEELERAFHDLADTIAGPGATNIHIEDIISTEFAIIGFEPPLIGERSWRVRRSSTGISPNWRTVKRRLRS